MKRNLILALSLFFMPPLCGMHSRVMHTNKQMQPGTLEWEARKAKMNQIKMAYSRYADRRDSINREMNLQEMGPICGGIAAWIVRAVCYGSITATATGVVVGSGGLAGAALGGLTTTATLSAGVGPTVVAGMIHGAGSAVSAEVAFATAGIITTTGTQTIAAIETAATMTQGAVTLIPWLP